MWFPVWSALGRLCSEHGTARRNRASTRLTVERLEDRTVPAAYTAADVTQLIQAIHDANATADADTITLAPGTTFSLTAVDNTAHGATGLPTILAAGGDLTIVGNGDTIERKSGNGTPAFRLLDVAAGASLTLKNVTLQGGLTVSYGGAVYNQGSLTLQDVTVQNNTAQGSDGVAVWNPHQPGGTVRGGGVYSSGILTMEGCTLQNNAALGGRGSRPFPSGDGGNAYGGGLFVSGTATIRNCSVVANSAQGGAAGGGHAAKGQGIGGGIYIDSAALVGLDAFTVSHELKNHASTSDDNIHGSYGVIL